jgi:hypothetical protein
MWSSFVDVILRVKGTLNSLSIKNLAITRLDGAGRFIEW